MDTLKRILSSKVFKITVILLVVAAVSVFVYKKYFGRTVQAASNNKVSTVRAGRGTITVSISGSGTINSSYRQDITANVDGTVKKVYFKEGDYVNKGDLMFELDDTEYQNTLKSKEIALEQMLMTLEDNQKAVESLVIRAPFSGRITSFTLSEGDSVREGTVIGKLYTNQTLKLTVPFNSLQLSRIREGQKATVYLQDYLSSVDGTVTYIDRNYKITESGGILYDVEITIQNPGTLISGVKASASVQTDYGEEMCLESGILEYEKTVDIKAETSGTVKTVNIRNNDQVEKNQVLLELENPDLMTTLKSTQLKVEDQKLALATTQKQQENYKITAPVGGTIIKQGTLEGDNVKKGTVLASLADYDQMEFTIPIDELDIAKVQKGMKVNVSVGAIEGKAFEGEVVEIASEGKTTNGVSTYDVTIKVIDPKGIKGGMNASAEVLIAQKENVLMVPISAIQRLRGIDYVLVKESGSSAPSAPNQEGSGRAQGRPVQDLNPGGGMPQAQGRVENQGQPSAQGRAGSQGRPSAESGTMPQNMPGIQGQSAGRPGAQVPANAQGFGNAGAGQNQNGSQPQGNKEANVKESGEGSANNSQDSAADIQVPAAVEAMLMQAAASYGEGVTAKVVKVGLYNEDYVEIISGLNEGEEVLIFESSGGIGSAGQRNNRGGGFGGGVGGIQIPGGGFRR